MDIQDVAKVGRERKEEREGPRGNRQSELRGIIERIVGGGDTPWVLGLQPDSINSLTRKYIQKKRGRCNGEMAETHTNIQISTDLHVVKAHDRTAARTTPYTPSSMDVALRFSEKE